MAKLEGISPAELHGLLEEVNERKPTQRLMLAILYKQGPSVPMIADWFDMRERTVYDWFDRMEHEPLEAAIYDDRRPGRPSKLSDDQHATFEAALNEPPAEHGFDAPAWTPDIAQAYLRREFGVEYTRRHVQRLLDDAGISW